MATEVILDGAMGKKFGKRWNLHIDSPAEALRMIEANKPGLINWFRDNLKRHDGYQVTCKYANGVTETIGKDELIMVGKIASIRFTPIIAGAGNVAKIIAGVVIIALVTWATWGTGTGPAMGFMGGVSGASATMAGSAMMMGAGLAMSGIVGMMTPQQKIGGTDLQQRADKTSYYFNGPVNTTAQGVPVSLIYGDECLVGSHPISASVTVDEVVE
ncbi:MAG: hypothetical protein ACXWT0_01605 [Methylobacter sp.]